MTNRIYTDLEYFYPEMTRTSGRPTAMNKTYIVQIAAIEWDTQQGKEIRSFCELIKPFQNLQLPKFFSELTHITKTQVDLEGIEFRTALTNFVNFCGELPVWTFNNDFNVWVQNCEYYNLTFPFKHRPFVKVKPLLSEWNLNPENYSSGTLYKATNITISGHVHNALHDVRSMAAAVHFFENHNPDS